MASLPWTTINRHGRGHGPRSRTKAAMLHTPRLRSSRLNGRSGKSEMPGANTPDHPDRDNRGSPKANQRGAARLAAVQALYQMDLAGTGLNEILAEFESHWLGSEVDGVQYRPAEASYFRDIVGGVVREQSCHDPQNDATLANGWPLKRIETVLRAVLRAGAYELAYRSDVPARVVTSEYVDVASAFVDKEETGMVNAVLDQLAHQLRAGEFAGGQGGAAYALRSRRLRTRDFRRGAPDRPIFSTARNSSGRIRSRRRCRRAYAARRLRRGFDCRWGHCWSTFSSQRSSRQHRAQGTANEPVRSRRQRRVAGRFFTIDCASCRHRGSVDRRLYRRPRRGHQALRVPTPGRRYRSHAGTAFGFDRRFRRGAAWRDAATRDRSTW